MKDHLEIERERANAYFKHKRNEGRSQAILCNRNSKKKWDDEEIDLILNPGGLTDKEVSNIIHRTVYDIIEKRYSLVKEESRVKDLVDIFNDLGIV